MPRWVLNFALGTKNKLKDFSGEILKKLNPPGPVDFPLGISAKKILKIQRFHKMRCYFDQNAKRKGSISYLTLTDNYQMFYLHVFVFVLVRMKIKLTNWFLGECEFL